MEDLSAAAPDKHDLYERCVQSPGHLVALLRAIHAGNPRTLGEDFAGTAALSRRWVERGADARAVAVDLDAEALRRHPEHPSITRAVADVRTVDLPADLIFVGNFSIGYLHTRGELLEYLRHARSRLEPGGVLVCDTYGGEGAFVTGHVHRFHQGADGARIRYTWEQREADPLTGMVTDVLSFRVERGGTIEAEIDDAFVYRWRLWSVPELRDAMREAGFERTDVYAKHADALDDEGNAYVLALEDPGEDLEESFILCVAAR